MSQIKLAPKNLRQCAENLDKLLREQKKGRIAITWTYLCQLTGRAKIETAFIDNLNEFCRDKENRFELALYRVDSRSFILFRTTLKFLENDPGLPDDEED